MKITDNISLLEILWTLSAFFGLAFQGLLFFRTTQDRHWLINSKANGDRDLRKNVALTSVLIFGGGVLAQLSYAAVGIIAMTQPGRNHGHPSHAQIATSAIFLVLSMVSALLAGVIYRRRTNAVKAVVDSYVRRDYDY